MAYKNKALALVKAVSALAVTACSLHVQAETCSAIEIDSPYLNVRSGPSTSFQKVGALQQGERYAVLAESGLWKKIEYADQPRWVYAKGYTRSITASCGTVQVKQTVYSGPGTAYRNVGSVSPNSKWIIASSQGDWQKIWYASEARWIHESALKQVSVKLLNLTINQGASTTESRYVTLYPEVSVSASYLQVSEKNDFSDASWSAYMATPPFTLSAENGIKQIYVRVKDSNGRISNVLSDDIMLKVPAPVVLDTRSIDREIFYTHYRTQFGPLSQGQVNGLNFILDNMEKDKEPNYKHYQTWFRQLAYMLATAKHEVANTYQPITEYGEQYCANYNGGCRYKGRGYVQLTHKYNYSAMSPITGADLLGMPERALEPDIAYRVMSYGMNYGVFTGKRLGSYILNGAADYYNARRVVNGLDKANLIQGYADKFQAILGFSSK